MSNIKCQDVYFMKLALAQAKKGELTARPNPAVGCVLVKEGQIIGEGFHPQAGHPHAEVFALRNAYEQQHDTRGATAYVTLEPCSHTGRTPPCANALIEAGISKVVVATLDPNPKVSGQGVARLEQAGVEVVVGVCETQAKELNAGFLKAMATNMPFVRLKIACSLDGKTALADGTSKWITGEEARADVQLLRAKSGAIITGSGTIMTDNPALTVRSLPFAVPALLGLQPKIVIVDRRGRIQPTDEYQVLSRADTLLWRDDLPALLRALVEHYQCYDVLVEAGGRLSGAFIEQDLVDELVVYQAPCLLGVSGKPMAEMFVAKLSEQKRLTPKSITMVGDDIKQILTFVR